MTGSSRTSVLIAGGGLTGLATALFLAWRGVPCRLVERHRDVSPHPRARGINPRTMELMRQVGLEPAIRDAPSSRALVANNGVIATESLAGRQIGALHQQYFMDTQVDLSDLSPTGWCLCHQDEYEPIIRAEAERLGAGITFGTELVSFDAGPDGVTGIVQSRDTGESQVIEADYLVAADGPGSLVREKLGIAFDGTGTLNNFMNIHFDADLRETLGDRRFIMAYTVNPAVQGALMPLDNAVRWLLHVLYDPRVNEPASFTDERCAELVRAATGVADLDVRVHSALPWEAAGRAAERFAEGRIFLVGDAAHVMPPSGAFGANVGIADAFDIAWKLAAVTGGHAGPGLLDSYDAERRPVDAATVRQAVLRSKDRPRLIQQSPPPADPEIVPDVTVWFGGRYVSGAVVPEAAEPDGVWAAELAGAPGTRAPHVPVDLGGRAGSTLDLYGRDFVLLTGGTAWRSGGDQAARRLGVPLAVHTLDDLGNDDRLTSAYGITAEGAVLVRPDGVVAWRSPGPALEPGRVLEEVLRRVLARTG